MHVCVCVCVVHMCGVCVCVVHVCGVCVCWHVWRVCVCCARVVCVCCAHVCVCCAHVCVCCAHVCVCCAHVWGVCVLCTCVCVLCVCVCVVCVLCMSVCACVGLYVHVFQDIIPQWLGETLALYIAEHCILSPFPEQVSMVLVTVHTVVMVTHTGTDQQAAGDCHSRVGTLARPPRCVG